MLESGVPLLKVLHITAESASDDNFADVAGIIYEDLRNGSGLSQAMRKFPLVFPRPVVAMVGAGEKSGRMVETMRMAAGWLEVRRDLRVRLKAAMVYPVFLLAFAGLGSLGITLVLLPELLEAVSNLGAPLHWTTRILVTLSRLAGDPSAWLVFLGLAGLAWQKASAHLRTEAGQQQAARILRSLPLLGPIYRALGLTDFLTTLGCMLNAGNDLLGSLGSAFQASGDAELASAVGKVRSRIEEGESLQAAMAADPDLFPTTVTGLVAVGEETGNLVDSLNALTVFYKAEAEYRLGVFSAALEPILLGLMSLVVGFLAVAFLMPMQGLLAGLT